MPTALFRSLFLLGPFCLMLGAQAQVDTTAIGGPDSGEDEFLMLDPDHVDAHADIEEAAHALGLMWDVNDSLSLIPSYDIYCHWNTDQLFLHHGSPVPLGHDTLMLHLAFDDCDMAMPTHGHVTSPFGPRKGRMHYGVDLKLQTGDPVRTAFDGMVRISRYNKSYGHVVVVRHFNGLETLYAHLSKRLVKPGDLGTAGDTLGLGGNTGRSYGSHLHFEVRFLDQPIDPSEIFDLSSGTLKVRTFNIHKGTFAAIAKAKADQAARKYHVVRSGDTLSAIGRRYGRSVAELCRMNGIKSTSVLRVGQRIRYN
jgi:murein DD-endopeptidase MepM/ murein hydrolase activator NlpD